MPYIAIKAYPKDEETKRRAVEQIQEIFLKTWGCPALAVPHLAPPFVGKVDVLFRRFSGISHTRIQPFYNRPLQPH